MADAEAQAGAERGGVVIPSGAIGPLGENLVFLIGLPRSGTSLLAHMLDRHPTLAAPREPWVMLALHQLGRVDQAHPADAAAVARAVATFVGETGLIGAARAAATTLYDAALAVSGKSVLVDKTPRYLFILDYLRAVFPRARLICLVRDPLDIAASFRSTFQADLPVILAGLRDEPFLFDFMIGLDRLERLVREPPAAAHLVRYEDLVTEPRRVLGDLLGGLGLAADPALVDTLCALQPSPRRAEEFGDRKIEQTRTPHAQSIGAWRGTFRRDELQQIIDAVGLERMQQLGYGATVAALAQRGVAQRPAATPARTQARIEAMFEARLSGAGPPPAARRRYLRPWRGLVQRLRGRLAGR